MFSDFYQFFGVTEPAYKSDYKLNEYNDLQKSTPGFMELFNRCEGASFGNGLYRLHTLADIQKWNAMILEAFPAHAGQIECFGYDWLGRHFGLYVDREVGGEPQIIMFEPGSGDVFEIPCSFIEFHNDEIPEAHDACLASSYFSEWLEQHPASLATSECVGYKQVLFLGGEDEVSNLEKGDMDVYWTICAQLLQLTSDLPHDTVIKNVTIKE